MTVDFSGSNFGGARLIAEDASGSLQALESSDPQAPLKLQGPGGRCDLSLSLIDPEVRKLRLFVWSESATRVLSPARALISVEGVPLFEIGTAPSSTQLRSAELLEIYQRLGEWKIRAVADGWQDHLAGMARATGLPESAFAGARPATPGSTTPGQPPAPRIDTRRRHQGPSPAVGPMALRPIVDAIAGPGEREGDANFLAFELGGVVLKVWASANNGFVQVAAVVALGDGARSDAISEAALRATGASPISRVSLSSEVATASAVAVVREHQLDTNVVKALFSDAWVTANHFATLAVPHGWSISDAIGSDPPRELRLGIGEELQDMEEWAGVRERLEANSCWPLADQPSSLLAFDSPGQLTIGPALLRGSSRAWAILVERVLRSDIEPRRGLWPSVAAFNEPLRPVRCGLSTEVGHRGRPMLTLSFGALQIPRTQILEDLQFGLDAIDDAVSERDPVAEGLMPEATWKRDDLPWPPSRNWPGPGNEVQKLPMARELASLPDGSAPPADIVGRIQTGNRGRVELGYLAHLALKHAEARRAAPAWLGVADSLCASVPPKGPGERCATGSLHARLKRLKSPPPPVQTPPPQATRSRQPPQPPQSQPPPPPPPGEPPSRRKRWRIFG